ncbi:hypothetical protein DSO57_1035169 [Entomophthora muscae]|uniref:Uncharacterized protein n=1 Tax=Entomophthora muscae TaxID=34485 RepID=A0ACC2UK00_9FUNG|nr:hypothetical protein DSO57_1035169 [Entomophthora muscae]
MSGISASQHVSFYGIPRNRTVPGSRPLRVSSPAGPGYLGRTLVKLHPSRFKSRWINWVDFDAADESGRAPPLRGVWMQVSLSKCWVLDPGSEKFLPRVYWIAYP